MSPKFKKNKSAPNSEKIIRVALAGNPNAGKTSLFNALTGQSQHVGNYPGVTVEKKSGQIEFQNRTLEIVDLPGTYSLTAYSIEEIVARDFVLQDQPDVIIDVIDSTNLERNLYLCLQFQELGVPVIGALNMSDEAEKQGIFIDAEQLSKILGIPFVKTVGTRGRGKTRLLERILQVVDHQIRPTERHLNYGPELENQHNILIDVLNTDPHFTAHYNAHWLAIKLIENDRDAAQKILDHHREAPKVLKMAEASREWIKKHFGEDSEVVVAEQRYAYIHGAWREAVQIKELTNRIDYTEMIDRVVLDRYFSVFFFFGSMFLIYQLTFKLGTPFSNLLDHSFTWLQNFILQHWSDGIWRDFVVEGIIGGVGGVLIFFPIVLFLFLGLSFLEDTGYMARAAFVMDKFMHLFGLHGRSFIPLMVSTGCAVPGVLAARTLVDPKDRILTIMVAPLMMCGAKTPVIAMLASAFFPKSAGIVFWSIWFFGWVLALVLALTFRNTLYQGEASPFVMELPPYRWPTWRGIWTHVWERSSSYVKKAGTFILVASVIIWAFLYFPRIKNYARNYVQIAQQIEQEYRIHLAALDSVQARTLGHVHLTETVLAQQRAQLTDAYHCQLNALKQAQRQEALTYSLGGRIGQWIEPIFRPCGFDWRIAVALFAGFTAKEVIVSSMGIIYGIGESENEPQSSSHARSPLKEKLSADTAYNPLKMIALMIFVLVYIPCLATLAVVKKELGKLKFPLFQAAYTLVVAWVLATLIFQGGRLLGLG